MHSGQEDDPLVFLWGNGQQSEIVCMVKCVLNCSFICFRQKAGWNARFVLFHRANQSELSGLHLHGQRNWPIIIVSGNVSACSRTDGTKSRTAWVGTGNSGAWVQPPVEILEESKKKVLLSARTYTLMPYLLGLFGMYSWNYTFLWIHGEIHQLCNQFLECSLLHKPRQICRICCE